MVAIFAHPDDEAFGTGGTLIKYAQAGVDVHLVMATCGEAGQVANPAVPATRPISLLREQELRRASEIYGLKQLHLLGYIDGQTAVVPPAEPVFRLVRLLRELRPQVVITFGPDGIYGHFDHLVVHRWASAAVELAAREDRWPEAGQPHTVARLYYRAVPESQLEQRRKNGERTAVDMGGVPFPFVGYTPEQITTFIDVSEFAQTKLQAIRCHASQLNPDTPLMQADFSPLEHDWFWQETFILAHSNGRKGFAATETDLFAGVK
ncbi:MAG: mycothiol conjugate amidase Mca [Anaerolineae bacterium]